MIYCQQCKHFRKFSNTEDCRLGICSFNDCFAQVSIDKDCPFMPRELKCLDCNHFENDAACMTALAEDSAENCPGFMNKQEVIIEEAINNLIYSGRFDKEKIQNIIDNCILHCKSPQD